MIFEQVSKAIKEKPKNWADELEESVLSFYYDTVPDGFDAMYELEQHGARAMRRLYLWGGLAEKG